MLKKIDLYNKTMKMKKIVLLVIVLVSGLVHSQEKPQYVEVNYDLILEMNPEDVLKNIPSQYRAAVEEGIRQELKDGIVINYVLKTNGKESTYNMVEKISNAQSQVGIITQQIQNSDKGITYKDLTNNTMLKTYEIFGQKYLIDDKLPEYTWEVSREKSKVLDFETRKATGTYNDSIQIEAWFTPKISIKDGPDRAWGLPGLILKTTFEANNANARLVATQVTVRDEDIEIKKPSEGKPLTQKEFEAEIKAITEQYQKMMQGGVDKED